MADDSLRIDSRAIYEGPETTTFGISAHLPRARTARESATPVSSRHLVRPIAYPFRANSGSSITTSPNPGGVKSPGYGINSNKSKSGQPHGDLHRLPKQRSPRSRRFAQCRLWCRRILVISTDDVWRFCEATVTLSGVEVSIFRHFLLKDPL